MQVAAAPATATAAAACSLHPTTKNRLRYYKRYVSPEVQQQGVKLSGAFRRTDRDEDVQHFVGLARQYCGPAAEHQPHFSSSSSSGSSSGVEGRLQLPPSAAGSSSSKAAGAPLHCSSSGGSSDRNDCSSRNEPEVVVQQAEAGAGLAPADAAQPDEAAVLLLQQQQQQQQYPGWGGTWGLMQQTSAAPAELEVNVDPGVDRNMWAYRQLVAAGIGIFTAGLSHTEFRDLGCEKL